MQTSLSKGLPDAVVLVQIRAASNQRFQRIFLAVKGCAHDRVELGAHRHNGTADFIR